MATQTRGRGSHGLGVLLEWIYTLPLERAEREVMIVYAKHANYWDGAGSRPSVPTVAKKARLKDRRVQYILRKLQADPDCERCGGTGNRSDEFGQTSRCDCHTAQRGYLIQRSPGGGKGQPATYDLNVSLKFSASSTASTNGSIGRVQSEDANGAKCTLGTVQNAPIKRCIPEHDNKEDRSDRSKHRSEPNTPPGGAALSDSLSHEVSGNYSPKDLQAWLAIKEAMRRHLSESEWKLWVRPARLLRKMSGNFLLIALPPNGHILAKATERKQLLYKVAGEVTSYRTLLTHYPDEWEIAEAKRRFGVDYSRKKPAAVKTLIPRQSAGAD